MSEVEKQTLIKEIAGKYTNLFATWGINVNDCVGATRILDEHLHREYVWLPNACARYGAG